MAKRYELVTEPDTNQPESSHTAIQTDWSLCAFCQEDTGDRLIHPVGRQHTSSGYDTLAENLLQFHKLGCIPLDIDIARLDDGSGISETLQSNNAGWHKSCSLQFCAMELQRAQIRAQKRKQEDEDNPSPIKTRSIQGERRSNRDESNKGVCFFCEEVGDKKSLHSAATANIDVTVRECVTELRDTRLLAKLSVGDMVAIDAMYHLSCLTKLRNRLRDHKTDLQKPKVHTVETLVFGELVGYIEETRQNEAIIPVFKLSALVQMYTARLTELTSQDEGIQSGRVHSTRLKERLLRQIPDLRAEQQGRDMLLMFKKDIGGAIKRAIDDDRDTDAIHLVRAAQIVRRDVFNQKYKFTGSFEQNCESDAIPSSLNALVRMILEGPNIQIQSHENSTKAHIAIVLSELLIFNTVKRSQASVGIRHNQEREAPFPIYLSMLIHAKTRKRALIDTMFDLGLRVSYDRMMSLSTHLANTVCAHYHAEQIVCPPQLIHDTFTCGAVDNIDHNPSARTASDSFHGTAISLIQFPTNATDREDRGGLRLDPTVATQNKISPLPASYTIVPPVVKTQDPIVPIKCGILQPDSMILNQDLAKEYQWLTHMQTLLKKETLEVDDYISWAAYHASQQPMLYTPVSNIALLPLFRDNAHSTCMISHAMGVVTNAIHHLNPEQIPVIVADQPLYAIAKQIQWSWPETHGEDKIVVLLGGLHIEMNIQKLLGHWLRESGWTTSLINAKITTSGRADAILSGSHVTRTRYAHQVTAASLYILQQRAYQHYLVLVSNDQSALSFDEWCVLQCANQPQFKYWSITLKLELMLLQFVRSLREKNFKMYVQCLLTIVPWLFTFDHTNYARWLPVHISDMVNLETTHPEVYRQFTNGHFVVQKTQNTFSAMAIDQCHEQVNELIKGDGGAVGLTENPQALERWMVAGPEISRLVREFEDSYQLPIRDKDTKHHEQYPGIQKTFAKDVSQLVSTLNDMGNPFVEDSGDMLTLDTKIIMNKDVVKTVYTAENIGQEQYSTYIEERLQSTSNKPLTDIIPKNKLPFFSTSHARQKSRYKEQVASLKTNCSLFSRLYIACQAREGNLDNFFEHENQACPPSISDIGQLRQGSKSDLLECLAKCYESSQVAPDVEAKVIDGAAVIHMLRPGGSRTFEDYAQQVFIPYIISQLEHVNRVDIIWDRYFANSIKQSTRERRMHSGTTQRQRVLPGAPVPRNWESFLRTEKNKVELFQYLSECVKSSDAHGKILITTQDHLVVTAEGKDLSDMEYLQPCTHEEADTRILLHVAHCTKQGLRRVAIRTVDTDVVVLAIGHFNSLQLDELWVSFGVGSHFRYIPIHEIVISLGIKANALMFFHAVTGCDTVSSFLGHGKKSAWLAWTTCADVTNVFLTLRSQPDEVSTQNLHKIERFIIVMYSRTCGLDKVNEARKKLFAEGSRSIENIPPTKAALLQHVKRAAYQAGYVWSQALVPAPQLPSPGLWGWTASNEGWTPYWTDLPEAAVSCYELVHCGCKKGCRWQCKCRSSNLQCTELCNCRGGCGDN